MHHQDIPTLRRPKILWRAARAGVGKLPLDVLLTRVLGGAPTENGAKLRATLLERESQWELERKQKRPDYSPSGHVLCLIALISLMGRQDPI